MYGMFGVESLAVEIIDGENSLKKYLLQVFSTCNRYSDQIAYIYIYYMVRVSILVFIIILEKYISSLETAHRQRRQRERVQFSIFPRNKN